MSEISQDLQFSYDNYREKVLGTIQKGKISRFILKFPSFYDFKHLGMDEKKLKLLVCELKNKIISPKIGELKYIKSKKIYFSESYTDMARIASFYAKKGSFYKDNEYLYYKKDGMWLEYWKMDNVRFSLDEIKIHIVETSKKNIERKISEAENDHEKLLKSLKNISVRKCQT